MLCPCMSLSAIAAYYGLDPMSWLLWYNYLVQSCYVLLSQVSGGDLSHVISGHTALVSLLLHIPVPAR